MNKWLLLMAAILLEVCASLSLRAALDHPLLFILVAIGYVGSFFALAFVLRLGVGVGLAYGIWGACGVALTATFASIIFGDPLTGTMGLGIALVIGGVLCVELGSRAAQARKEGTTA